MVFVMIEGFYGEALIEVKLQFFPKIVESILNIIAPYMLHINRSQKP